MTVTKQVSLHGKRAYLTKDDMLVGRNAIATGGVDKPTVILPGSPDTVALWEDFLYDTGYDGILRANTAQWRVAEADTGNDTGTDIKLVPATNGVARMNISTTNSHAGATTGVAWGAAIMGNLAWKANQGSGPNDSKNGLRFACRLKANTYTDTGRQLNIFAGFTDTNALEATPVYDTGGVLLATANDAVGFFYSGGADTGWSGVSVAGGGTPQQTHLDNTRQAIRGPGGANTSNTYDVLEMEIHHGPSDTGGTVTFWINGQPKGYIESPITSNVALTPIVHMSGSDTGGGMVVDVDWINVSAPRDTGT